MFKPEHILAAIVPSTYFNSEVINQSLSGCRIDLRNFGLTNPENLVMIQRNMAEQNPSFKQFIPYVCIRNAQGEYLQYRRMTGSGESRLLGKTSIGFGGHVDAVDVVYSKRGAIDLVATLDRAIRRELQEELGLQFVEVPHCRGFIFDDSTMVGQVHMGLLFILDVAAPDSIKSQEGGIALEGWKHPRDLLTDEAEEWSKAVLKFLMTQGG